MSLLSNRGRFSNLIINVKMEKYSILSSIGTNPHSIFDNNSDKNTKIIINKKSNDNSKKQNNISHTDYNDSIKKYNETFSNEYKIDEKSNRDKKGNSLKLLLVMIVIEAFTLFGVISLGTFIRLKNMTQNITFNKSAVQNTNIGEATLQIMKGYKTVAIFGVDSRTGSVDRGNNADVNLIVNLNLETGNAQLVSIYRDLYLSITDNNSYGKLNAAYSNGGPENAVKTINKNFDLNIQNFFSFNWKAVADGIELLGGIDLEITKSEFKYMNAFIHETCIATGIDAKNPAAHYIKKAGEQHLDGVQSVAYGRLRLMDSDFQRVERQKKVISLCLQKAKELDLPRLRLIMDAVIPQIAYEFDMNEMLSILKIVKKINITASVGCPETSNIVTMNMGHSGDCVVPLSLEKACKKLHNVLYDDEDYTVSTAVRKYSNRIIELMNKYKIENESRKVELELNELESQNTVVEEKNSNIKKKVSTMSNVKKNDELNDVRENTTESNITESSTTGINDNEIIFDTPYKVQVPGEEVIQDTTMPSIVNNLPLNGNIIETESNTDNQVIIGNAPSLNYIEPPVVNNIPPSNNIGISPSYDIPFPLNR